MANRDSTPADVAQRAADGLALALEDVGFDVGRVFPALRGNVESGGTPTVELGRITAEVAAQLTAVLSDAARHGVTTSQDPPGN